MKRSLILILILLTAPAFAQAIYKCPSPTPGGAVILQQKPCSAGGEAIPPTPPGTATVTEGDKALLEKQERNSEVLGSMVRQNATYQEGSLGGGGGGRGGKSVHVRGYTRSDGTAVRSYYRAAPRR